MHETDRLGETWGGPFFRFPPQTKILAPRFCCFMMHARDASAIPNRHLTCTGLLTRDNIAA